MRYAELATLLHLLEDDFRKHSLQPNPQLYPCHIRIRQNHHMQFFALSNRTRNITEDLPIVVAVGINYTQGVQAIPDQAADPQNAIKAVPLVEDSITSYESNYISSFNANPTLWKTAHLCSSQLRAPLLQQADEMIQPYHLVMTNLSPWITTDSWGTIAEADGLNITSALLTHPPQALKGNLLPFGHIRELKDRLNEKTPPSVWIGHGIHSVWEHFVILMNQMDVDQWMLTRNLSYPWTPRFLEL